jgi:probable HAF family extracellular repeat protein
MNTASRFLTWSFVLLLVPLATGQQFAVTDVGSLDPGGLGDVSFAYGINSFGEVVGSSYTATLYSQHAYIWTKKDGIHDLGTFGGSNSFAYAIDDFGTVVGESQLASGEYHAFSWTKSGGMQDLGTLGGTYSSAFATNNYGQVVGQASTATGLAHAFLWTKKDGMLDLGTLGGNSSEAYAINNYGGVVGASYSTGNGDEDAFFWDMSKGMKDLGTKKFDPSLAYGINGLGQVVGQGFAYVGVSHATLQTEAGAVRDLGTLGGDSIAYAINDHGAVVGTSSTVAFLWTTKQGMRDLNLLIPKNSGWILGVANALNAAGQITGSGPVLINGNDANHAFLLTPTN